MSESVIAIVSSQAHAQSVIASLKGAGFSDREISIVTHKVDASRDLTDEAPAKGAEAATAGAITGGAVGGTIAVLAGIGLLAIPGVGPFIAAGPLLAALSGAAVGAAVGGVSGGLIGLGIPEVEAKAYEARLHRGDVLLAVHATDGERIARAKEIFKHGQATDIRVVGERVPPAGPHLSA